MPGIVALVAAISADVVAALATAGLPALTDGKILLGRQHVYEQSAPPRIVFVPTGTTWGPRSVTSPSRVNGYPSTEIKLEHQIRSLATDSVQFDVHVWGAASPPDPDGDFDVTQLLYHQVVRSTHMIAAGVYRLDGGTWSDQAAGAAQLVKAGHEYVFSLTLATPLPDAVLPYAPSAVAPDATSQLVPSIGGAPEIGCAG